MALTINRNNEITEEQFLNLKEMFDQNTNTRAIYTAVEFTLNKLPVLKQEIEQLKSENKKLKQQFERVLLAINQKNEAEQELQRLKTTIEINTEAVSDFI